MLVILFIIILVGISGYKIHEFRTNLKLLKTVTTPNRGTRSERMMVLSLLKNNLNSQTIYHDLYLKNKKGRYTQIDLVVLTDVGIIVFEIKEYSGWIFGTGHQKYWTQVLAYGRSKFRLYNPILQNKKHIEDLTSLLPQFENIPFYSIVVFFGNCEFKDLTFIPDDVFLIKANEAIDVVQTIILDNQPVRYIDKIEIFNLLNAAARNGEDKQIREQHIRNIQYIIKQH
jgi:hypothetical protein